MSIVFSQVSNRNEGQAVIGGESPPIKDFVVDK
jgi:hypothetical protein